MPKFYGKYRGRVTDNNDPGDKARVQVIVPSVLGEDILVWAMPCSPFAGPGVGFVSIPPVDASVWIEFEAGDPRFPIWAGCFWQEGELPSAHKLSSAQFRPNFISIITEYMSLTVDDNAGGVIVIESNSGARIELTPTEVKIDSANAKGVSINNHAF